MSSNNIIMSSSFFLFVYFYPLNVRVVFDYFFVKKTFLVNKYCSVGKPVNFSLNGATFVKTLHLSNFSHEKLVISSLSMPNKLFCYWPLFGVVYWIVL